MGARILLTLTSLCCFLMLSCLSPPVVSLFRRICRVRNVADCAVIDGDGLFTSLSQLSFHLSTKLKGRYLQYPGLLISHRTILILEQFNLLTQIPDIVISFLHTAINEQQKIINLVNLHFLKRIRFLRCMFRPFQPFTLNLLSDTLNIPLLMPFY